MTFGLRTATAESGTDLDSLLCTLPEASIFHSTGWSDTLSESYGYTRKDVVSMEGSRLDAFLPLMEIKSVLTGTRAVSLPFSDYCDPVVREGISFREIMQHLVEEGKRSGWKSIELRLRRTVPADATPSVTFLHHVLPLEEDEGRIHSGFRGSTQRNIRKAEKEGVRTEMSASIEAVRDFYRLNCLTRRDHGLPPQPYRFFRNLHRNLLEKNHGFVVLAAYRGTSIAGGLYLHFGDKGFYKFGASDRRYQNLRANNLVMWEAIRWFCRNGFRSFCFGRTERENDGLVQFKSGWGAEESVLRYYRYDLRTNGYTAGNPLVTGIHNRVFRTLPIALSKVIGSALYRHMG